MKENFTSDVSNWYFSTVILVKNMMVLGTNMAEYDPLNPNVFFGDLNHYFFLKF